VPSPGRHPPPPPRAGRRRGGRGRGRGDLGAQDEEAGGPSLAVQQLDFQLPPYPRHTPAPKSQADGSMGIYAANW